MKFKKGSITNPKTGKTKDIVLKTVLGSTVRDTIIGGSLIITGICYLTLSAFKNGANVYEKEEFKTMKDLDIIKEDET